MIGCMKSSALAQLAFALALGLTSGASWAQAAPAAAAATSPAATPAATPASLPSPLLVLPQWAQDKIVAARTDKTLNEQAYKHGAKLATFCANCHGPAGHSATPDVPNLAGQNTIYVLNQLNKFHDGRRRGNFFMERVVRAMSNEERYAVAVYYTQQEPKNLPPPDAKLAETGKALYEKGCKRCHGETGAGSERNSRLAGQFPEYLDMSIKRYRDNNIRSEERMYKATKSLTDSDIKALAAYIGSLQ
jgi:cytochrome c553